MQKLFAAAMGSVVALLGFAGAANASATIDLIWAASGTDTTSNVTVSSNITLRVILTAGPNGSVGGGISVDYSEVLGTLAVIGYMNTTGPPFGISLGSTIDTGSRIENIHAAAFPAFVGIGLVAGASAQLGTVTFHKSVHLNGTFEIASDANGPVDDILDLLGYVIPPTITLNSAFLINEVPTPTPTPTAPPTPTPTATPTPTPTATPSTDTDSDGIPDGIDNCPFVPNNDQTNSDSLPPGDACQCGDVDNENGVTLADVARAQENLLGVPLGGAFDPTRCNVIGPSDGGVSDCDIADIFILQRFLAGSPVTVETTCDAYSAP